MAVFNEPSKWQTSLVNSGDANTIPQSTPAGTGEASFEDGFPQITQVPIGAGGIAPDRKDFNGLFKVLGDWIFFAQNGGLPTYSPDFDYVVGRYVVYNNTLYKCIQSNGASSTVVAPDSVSPLGSDYWKDIENQDSTSLIPNQLIVSPVPLTDANLHLLDGALLSGSGAYSAYVAMMANLCNADPTATCWTDEATWQASVTQYGECGKFVYDSVNNTLRLPKVITYIMATNTASELGSLVEAGIPDHSHTVWGTGGALSGQYQSGGIPVASLNTTSLASASNPIYGNSNTVQTQAIKYYHYIVVGTVSKTDIQIDIDNVLADLANKADKDFSNATPNQAFKNNSVSWVMPDYDSGIDLTGQITTTLSSITIPEDGLLTMVISVQANRCVYIDSTPFLGAYSNGLAVTSTRPISKGTYNMRSDYALGSGIATVIFYPCKGVN